MKMIKVVLLMSLMGVLVVSEVSAGTYKKMEYSSFCSGSWARITSEATCRSAAAALNLKWAHSWNGPGDFPGCLHTKDSRNSVYFNTSPKPSNNPNVNANYAEICQVQAEISCPSLNTNTLDRRDREVLKRIGSAGECSKKCRANTTCNFWSWHHKDAGIWALDCVLMSGYGYSNSDNNVISGSRTCNPGAPPCGIENSNNRRIIGGNEARPNQYPWMVWFPTLTSGCGGSLITDKHVLTSAHCVALNQLRGAKAKVGLHNRNDGKEVPIKSWECPGGDCEDTDHDIAIVVLDQSVDLNDKNMGTVCLPGSNYEDYKGKKAHAMGWGWFSSAASNSQSLRGVELTVAQKSEENFLFTEVRRENGEPIDACSGDSGGPLVHRKSSRWTVIATRSTGGDCTNHSGRLGRWNKVTDHLDWIKNVMKN